MPIRVGRDLHHHSPSLVYANENHVLLPQPPPVEKVVTVDEYCQEKAKKVCEEGLSHHMKKLTLKYKRQYELCFRVNYRQCIKENMVKH
ncbi:hypothetical protein TIFTF001_029376 [Ficus carica]|uniref:Uncharacterized protein n=1 Tax=Ficus carica TaxID=3494 RepID=A0AA88DRE7_FICCA|nr:hypothetical protein TIFTF001_029376 [Ficus carica]